MAAIPPVSVQEFKELVVGPDDSLVTGIIKTYVRLPILAYRFARWFLDLSGNITPDARDWLCAGCNLLQEEENMEDEEEEEET